MTPGGVLYCGTFGRGIWAISNFLGSFLPAAAAPIGTAWPRAPISSTDPGVLNVTGDDSNNNILLTLDAGNPDVLDVFIDNTTDTPDFSIDLNAVEGISVTGGMGNDTLTIDDANGMVSVPGGISFDQTTGDVRQEINQTPIDSGIVSKIRSGLQSLADFGTKLTQLANLAQQIPDLGMSLAQVLPIGNALQTWTCRPDQQFLHEHGQSQCPTACRFHQDTQQSDQRRLLLDRSIVSQRWSLHEQQGNQDLRFDLDLQLVGFAGQLSLAYGTSLSSLGVAFNSSGTVDLTAGLNLALSFGVDLTPGLSDSNAFFIKVNDLSATAHVRRWRSASTAGIRHADR